MKKWLCMFVSVVMLLCCVACSQSLSPTSMNNENRIAVFGDKDTEIANSSYAFENAGVDAVSVVDKNTFSSPIICNHDGKTIIVTAPIFTGIPATAVYYQQNHRFVNGFATLSIATEDGAKTLCIDTKGRITEKDAPISTTDEAYIWPSSIGADYSAGEGMYLYSDHSSEESLYGLMDEKGNIITSPQYVGYLNFYGGYAVAQKANGTYVAIDSTGKEYGILPGGRSAGEGTVIIQDGTPGNYSQYLYSIQGERLSEGYDCISYFENGLALIEKDNKVGIIDNNGTVILPPTIAFDTITYPPTTREYRIAFLDNNAFLLPIGGEFAVISIQR